MRREEFWDSTFGEIEVFFEAAAAARIDAFDQAVTIGWNAERFARLKRLESLGKYLHKPERASRGTQARTAEREIEIWDKWYAKRGIKGK